MCDDHYLNVSDHYTLVIAMVVVSVQITKVI